MSDEMKWSSGGQGGKGMTIGDGRAQAGGGSGSGGQVTLGGAGGGTVGYGTPLNQSKRKFDWAPIQHWIAEASDLAVTLCIVMVSFSALITVLAAVVGLADSKSCANYASRLQVNAEWNWWLGCTVQLEDGTLLTREAHQQMLSNRHRVTLEAQ